eukprot:6491005-Prymnesium_polylepis.2
MRHAYYTRKTQTPRYEPRGGAPYRNVTSTRRRLGSQRAESTCPAQRAAAQRDNATAVHMLGNHVW